MTSIEEDTPVAKPMRLQRFLAQCGLGSRRDCEELITTGRVTVDGVVADQLGTTVIPSTQIVTMDGERLRVQRKKYFMLNKPSGYLCTADDPEGRRLVLDLFPEEGPRLFTVGRLDENTTGLILVTNDGDLAQKLAHPRYRIFRTYEAQVAGVPRPEVYEQLRQGLFFTEGKFRVHSVKPIKKQKDSTWVEIVMTEGQNREIRRLFARVGHKIMKLERQGYGPLRLSKLNRGEYRELTREELTSLHAVLIRNRAEEGNDSSARGRTSGRPAGRSATGRPGERRSEFRGGERSDRRPAGRGERPPRRDGERSFGGGDRRPGAGRPARGEGFGDRVSGGRPQSRKSSDFESRSGEGRGFGGGERRERPQRSEGAGRPSRFEKRPRQEFGERADSGQGFKRGERTGHPAREGRPSEGGRPERRERSESGEKRDFGKGFSRGGSKSSGGSRQGEGFKSGPGGGSRKPGSGRSSERHVPGQPGLRRPVGARGTKRKPPRPR